MAGTEVVNSEKQERIHENCFSNFCESQLIIEGIASRRLYVFRA
ncbi:MAG: hypothetical protein ACI32O_08380 [Enterococcus sp.]